MTTEIVDSFIRPTRIIDGKRGDGVPFSDVIVWYTYNGVTVDKANYTVVARVHPSRGSADVSHTFTVTLQDNSDDAAIAVNDLQISLTPLTAAESSALTLPKYFGDIEITQTGLQPQTLVNLELRLEGDPAQ
jgi:hypothetical protein